MMKLEELLKKLDKSRGKLTKEAIAHLKTLSNKTERLEKQISEQDEKMVAIRQNNLDLNDAVQKSLDEQKMAKAAIMTKDATIADLKVKLLNVERPNWILWFSIGFLAGAIISMIILSAGT